MEYQSKELVKYNIVNRVAYITINRPEKRNAFNPELVEALTDMFLKAGHDHEAKIIVLKANGTVFSAGADLGYLQSLESNSEQDNLEDTIALKELFYTIYTLPKLVIAQVEGHAIAGGCGLASVCDIIFSVPEAKFGYTEANIGFVPALVTCFLTRKIGEGRAKELLLTGILIDADKASFYGLINFISESSQINSEVSAYAEKLVTSVSGQSVALTKQLIHNSLNSSLEDSLDEAVKLNVRTRASADFKKGVSGFLEKGKLEW